MSEDDKPVNRIEDVEKELERISCMKKMSHQPRKLDAGFRARYAHYVATGTYFDEEGNYDRMAELARLERDMKRMGKYDGLLIGNLEEERADIKRLSKRFVFAPNYKKAGKAESAVKEALEGINRSYELPKELMLNVRELVADLEIARGVYLNRVKEARYIINKSASDGGEQPEKDAKPVSAVRNRIGGIIQNE